VLPDLFILFFSLCWVLRVRNLHGLLCRCIRRRRQGALHRGGPARRLLLGRLQPVPAAPDGHGHILVTRECNSVVAAAFLHCTLAAGLGEATVELMLAVEDEARRGSSTAATPHGLREALRLARVDGDAHGRAVAVRARIDLSHGLHATHASTGAAAAGTSRSDTNTLWHLGPE